LKFVAVILMVGSAFAASNTSCPASSHWCKMKESCEGTDGRAGGQDYCGQCNKNGNGEECVACSPYWLAKVGGEECGECERVEGSHQGGTTDDPCYFLAGCTRRKKGGSMKCVSGSGAAVNSVALIALAPVLVLLGLQTW